MLNCQWAGVSTVPGSWVMLNAMCASGVIIPELGHNYGLYHSNVLLPSGTYVPYLDYSCAMGVGTGGGNDAKCYSLPQVRALGIPLNVGRCSVWAPECRFAMAIRCA